MQNETGYFESLRHQINLPDRHITRIGLCGIFALTGLLTACMVKDCSTPQETDVIERNMHPLDCAQGNIKKMVRPGYSVYCK